MAITEKGLRDILRDWLTEINISTIIERNDATADIVAEDYVLRADTDQTLDSYDKAMTFIEKRLGLTLPTTVDAYDLLFEYGCELYLCNRILARQVGAYDKGDNKTSQVYKNVGDIKKVIQADYDRLLKEVWGSGFSSRRTTTGTLEIVTHSMVSDNDTQITNGDILELDD
jgi:hypothetical protein